jgi:hypothetical protein
VQEHVIAFRDAPPENLKRVPGPKAILYYVARDPALQGRTTTLPRSTRTIWKILHQPMERPAPMTVRQIDFKDASTVPAAPTGKQQHVVEILNVVDMGTSLVVAAQVHDDYHAQTADARHDSDPATAWSACQEQLSSIRCRSPLGNTRISLSFRMDRAVGVILLDQPPIALIT